MARYITVDNAAARYPTDGRGAASATDTESETVAASAVLLKHFQVTGQHTAETTVTILEHDGTTVVYTIVIPATTTENFVGKTIPIGIGVDEGFSVKTSNAATTGHLVYDFT